MVSYASCMLASWSGCMLYDATRGPHALHFVHIGYIPILDDEDVMLLPLCARVDLQAN